MIERTERQLFIEDLAARYPVPAQWGQGPIPDRIRSPTDTPCLLLYGLFCIFLLGSGVWAFSNSSRAPFHRVVDSSGNVCGEGAAKSHPILYLQTFSEPFRSVCVSECPKFDYNQLRGESSAGQLGFAKFSRKFAGNSYTHSNVLTEAEAFAYPEYWANNHFTKRQWDEYVSRVKVDCLPNREFSNCGGLTVYDSYVATRSVCTPLSPKAALLFNKVSSRFSLGDLEDLRTSVPLFLWTAGFSILISLIFLAAVSFLAKQVVWLLLGFTTAALVGAAATIFCGLYGNGFLNNPINPLRVKYLQFWLDHKPLLLLVGVGLLAAAGLAAYGLILYRKYAGISKHLIRYASQNVFRNLLLLGVSLAVLVLQFAVFFLEIATIIRLYTTGRELAAPGSPFFQYENPWTTSLLIAAHFFGLYWHLCVLNGLNDFVISATVVDFYFRSRISVLHAVCHTLGYHLGSVCWSLVLIPAAAARYVFGIIDFCITSDTPNALQSFARKACSVCCWVWENFVDSISERYMPITYIGCYNFYPANQTAYGLSQIHGDHVGVLLNVGDIIAICSRIIVTLASSFLGYRIYVSSIYYQQNIDNLWLMWICLLLISWFTADLFLSLFSTTYDTIFMSHLIEVNLSRRGIPSNHAPQELIQSLNEYRSYMSMV